MTKTKLRNRKIQAAFDGSHCVFQDVMFDTVGYNVKAYPTYSSIIDADTYAPSQILWVQAERVLEVSNGDFKAAFTALTGDA